MALLLRIPRTSKPIVKPFRFKANHWPGNLLPCTSHTLSLCFSIIFWKATLTRRENISRPQLTRDKVITHKNYISIPATPLALYHAPLGGAPTIWETLHYPIALLTMKQTENMSSTHALRFAIGNDRQRTNLKDLYPQQIRTVMKKAEQYNGWTWDAFKKLGHMNL